MGRFYTFGIIAFEAKGDQLFFYYGVWGNRSTASAKHGLGAPHEALHGFRNRGEAEASKP